MDEIEKYIANDKIDLAVVINENASGMDFKAEMPVTIISSQNSTLAGYMETVLSARIADYESQKPGTVPVSENAGSKKGVPIRNALGIIIFKMIGTSSSLAVLIIMEKTTYGTGFT